VTNGDIAVVANGKRLGVANIDLESAWYNSGAKADAAVVANKKGLSITDRNM